MGDLNAPKAKLEGTLYVKCDVTSWDDQAAMFKQAYEWQGRLDFAALNAGIDDRDDIFNSVSSDTTKPPNKPNMKTIEVCLYGAYYGCKLAAHYMTLDSTAAGKSKTGGKIVATASAAGIYPGPLIPQYTAAKHGIVGLIRSVASRAALINIKCNAVCPALVRTNLPPPGLMDNFTEDQFTPMSTIIRIFSELADVDNVSDPDWVEKGPSGETVEGNLKELIHHKAPSRPETSSYQNEEGQKAWTKTYLERNRKFGIQNWDDEELRRSGGPLT